MSEKSIPNEVVDARKAEKPGKQPDSQIKRLTHAHAPPSIDLSEQHRRRQMYHHFIPPGPYHPYPYTSFPPRHIHSVVTSSFSHEEVLDEKHGRRPSTDMTGKSNVQEQREPYGTVRPDKRSDEERDGSSQPQRKPMPKNKVIMHRSSMSDTTDRDESRNPIKRNYYHHANQIPFERPLPSEFLPPKRSKHRHDDANESRYFVTGQNFQPWGGEIHHASTINQVNSLPVHWIRHGESQYPVYSAPYSREHVQVTPSRQDRRAGWAHSAQYHTGPVWELPRIHEAHTGEQQPPSWRLVQMESGLPHDVERGNPGDKLTLMADVANDSDGEVKNNDLKAKPMHINWKGEKILLLSLLDDRNSLSETLSLVRENIEVFEAKIDDVVAPAPGRKNSISVGQVGLRCIHCRHTSRSSDRVKRAVCYPSSIKRIYRTVIDMKLDHFTGCQFVPHELKARLEMLKMGDGRSMGTTMQYFIKAAHRLGMVDVGSGVRFNVSEGHESVSKKNVDIIKTSSEDLEVKPADTQSSCFPIMVSTPDMPSAVLDLTKISPSYESKGTSTIEGSHEMSNNGLQLVRSDSSSFSDINESKDIVQQNEINHGMLVLSTTGDRVALSPLRCFLREHVVAFSAKEEDISLRVPTSISLSVGQVGIGCKHCINKAPNLRSNRATSFPFSIERIYQCVADIQRFHFGECQNLPLDVREKFLALSNASSKGSRGLATRQYWITSAKKLGLVDTPKGIRFSRDPSMPEVKVNSLSLDILAQAALSITSARQQLVSPADKFLVPEFLYVVMEQLQPCRFTDADRNKRRLKDVGHIGVECKHCAGEVDGRKFFWSSVSAVESNFVSVHNHMLECRMVPPDLKERLIELKTLRREQTAALKVGSQKAFFARVWDRLHEGDALQSQAVADDNDSDEESYQDVVKKSDRENEFVSV